MNRATENTDWQIVRQIENRYPGLQRILQSLGFTKVFNVRTFYTNRNVTNFDDYALELDIGSIFTNGNSGSGSWDREGRTIHTRNGTLDNIEGLPYSLIDASNDYSIRKWNFTTFVAGGRVNKNFEIVPETRRLEAPPVVVEPGTIVGSISFVRGNTRRIFPSILVQNIGNAVLDGDDVSDRRIVAMIRIADLIGQLDDVTLEREIHTLERLIATARQNT